MYKIQRFIVSMANKQQQTTPRRPYRSRNP